MKTIVVTDTEKHPVAPGLFQEGDRDKVAVFFGLHKDRGDNVIWSSRVTDDLFDAMRKYGLTLVREEPTKKCSPLDLKARFHSMTGVSVDLIGVALNVRRTYSPEQYASLLKDITESI